MRPRTQDEANGSGTEASEEEDSDEEASATEQRRRTLLKDQNGYYVIDAHVINELLDTSKPGRRFLQTSYTPLRYNTPATQSIDGC